MSASAPIHERAISAEGRELCLAMARVCEALHQWDGAGVLRRAAEHLYHVKFRELMRES